MLKLLAECLVDYRALKLIEGNTESLIKQLTRGLAPDYDGLNDYYELRKALSMAVICGQAEPTGELSQKDPVMGRHGRVDLMIFYLFPDYWY